jgi:hypothetical protein
MHHNYDAPANSKYTVYLDLDRYGLKLSADKQVNAFKYYHTLSIHSLFFLYSISVNSTFAISSTSQIAPAYPTIGCL